MKLTLAIATVSAVTQLMLKKGSGEEATKVPAKALTLKADVEPAQLDQLREGLSDILFAPAQGGAPRVPALPEVGALDWKVEYENGTLALDLSQLEDLDFPDEHITLSGVSAKDITLEPLATGMVAIKVNAVMETDDAEIRGKLDALLQHTVRATFSKLTQKPLIAPEKPADDAASRQEPLALH